MKSILYGIIITGISILFPINSPSFKTWQKLDKGLFFANFQGIHQHYNFDIYVLKINPQYYSLKLLMSTQEPKKNPKSLKEWVEEYRLLAAINASMFWEDRKTSTGYMRDKNIINQHHVHKKYGGFLAFNPRIPGIPYIKIVEIQNNLNWKSLLKEYDSVVQNFRMIGNNRKNLWHKDNNSYSVSAIGITDKNYVLFIFSLKPLPIHELNNILLSLPINIYSCVFTEGGATAGLYIKVKDFVKDLCGEFKIGIFPTSYNRPQIPNIIGVKKRIQGEKK